MDILWIPKTYAGNATLKTHTAIKKYDGLFVLSYNANNKQCHKKIKTKSCCHTMSEIHAPDVLMESPREEKCELEHKPLDIFA